MTKETLQDIVDSTKDLLMLDFDIVRTQSNNVPGYEDQGLSFERGTAKRAKTICTCVLYADIRNSTTLSHQHPHETMARLYTAFTKSLLKIAEFHGAVVRNIIGDRVMMLFPENNCFKMASDAAISINTVSKYIIDRLFVGLKFEVGIGIDYGEMLVVKAGIPKKEPERTNYKNLIWIGKPANIASKLTDVASKATKTTSYKVTYFPYNTPPLFDLSSVFPFNSPAKAATGPYTNYTWEDEISESTFIERIGWDKILGTTYSRGRFVSFEKIEKEEVNSPILMSKATFDGLIKSNANDPVLLKNLYAPKGIKVKDYVGTIYGGDVHWANYPELKF